MILYNCQSTKQKYFPKPRSHKNKHFNYQQFNFRIAILKGAYKLERQPMKKKLSKITYPKQSQRKIWIQSKWNNIMLMMIILLFCWYNKERYNLHFSLLWSTLITKSIHTQSLICRKRALVGIIWKHFPHTPSTIRQPTPLHLPSPHTSVISTYSAAGCATKPILLYTHTYTFELAYFSITIDYTTILWASYCTKSWNAGIESGKVSN